MIDNLIIYLIESSICFGILYLFYKYIYYKTTHFEWNRFYLLSIIFISILIPFISFPVAINSFDNINNSVNILNPLDGTALIYIENSNNSIWSNFNFLYKNKYFNISNFLFIIYITGLIRFAIVNIKNNLQVIYLIKKFEIISKDNYKIVKINSKQTAFTWFRYIFLSQKYYNLNTSEQNQILKHEEIHAKQLHTIDLIIFQLLEIVFWFNPFINQAKNTIKEIHEFIVDYTISENNNIVSYTDLIVKLSINRLSIQSANAFAKFAIKNRLQLLAFPPPSKLKKMAFIGGIPLMLMIILSYSFTINQINKSLNKLQTYSNINFIMPIEYNYEIASNFYMKQEIDTKINNKKVFISHPEISLTTESFTDVLATKSGIVTNIDTFDNWRVNELIIRIKHNKMFTSVYKGIWKSELKEGKKIKQSEIVGKTGDKRLYPILNYQLLKNGKPVDPILYIKN